jgi:hypothetical protein
VLETCTLAQQQILRNGSAVVEDFVLVGYKQGDGSVVLYNGTSGGGNGTGSSSSGSAAKNVAGSMTVSVAVVFLPAALMMLQVGVL